MPLDPNDPFNQVTREKVPSLSFKGSRIGDGYELTVTGTSEKVHGPDFDKDDGSLAYWEDGKPKYSIVLPVTVDKVVGLPDIAGQKRALWATIPSAMTGAIAEALKKIDRSFVPGDKLSVYHAGDEDKGAKKNARKLYEATVTPVNQYVEKDPPF